MISFLGCNEDVRISFYQHKTLGIINITKEGNKKSYIGGKGKERRKHRTQKGISSTLL